MSNIIYRPIEEMDVAVDSSERPYKVFYSYNMGNRTFLIKLPIFEFYRMSEVANEEHILNVQGNPDDVAQRSIDINHANKLANYVLKGLVATVIRNRSDVPKEYSEISQLLGQQPYISIPPFVCNIRTCGRDGAKLKARSLNAESNVGSSETVAHEVLLSQQHLLWVIDGQHRRTAIEYVLDFLDHVLKTHSYPGNKKSIFPVPQRQISAAELGLWNECNTLARTNCTIAAEVHLGLNAEEERQLFHDLNKLGKKVETSLSIEFDRGNPINIYVLDTLVKSERLTWPIIKKDSTNWASDKGGITLKDLTSISTRLLINKTNPKGATPAQIEPRIEFANKFWDMIQLIPHLGEPNAKSKTVAAQPVVLKALAKLAYDFTYGKDKNSGCLDKLFALIPTMDFSHKNPIWRYYQDERIRKDLKGLEAYLPSDKEGYNRDIGGYDPNTKHFRFGAKHNDIYPIIGDMIRWSLKLPNRHKKK